MNFFDHKDLENHLLQQCPQVVKYPVYAALHHRRYINTLCGVRLAILLPDATPSVMSSPPPPLVQCLRPWSVIYCRCVNQRVEDEGTSNAPWVLVSCVKINQVEIFTRAFCVNYLHWNENVLFTKTLWRIYVEVTKFIKKQCYWRLRLAQYRDIAS